MGKIDTLTAHAPKNWGNSNRTHLQIVFWLIECTEEWVQARGSAYAKFSYANLKNEFFWTVSINVECHAEAMSTMVLFLIHPFRVQMPHCILMFGCTIFVVWLKVWHVIRSRSNSYFEWLKLCFHSLRSGRAKNVLVHLSLVLLVTAQANLFLSRARDLALAHTYNLSKFQRILVFRLSKYVAAPCNRWCWLMLLSKMNRRAGAINYIDRAVDTY